MLTGFTSLFLRESNHYFDRLHDFSVTIPKCYKDDYVNSFYPHMALLTVGLNLFVLLLL